MKANGRRNWEEEEVETESDAPEIEDEEKSVGAEAGAANACK